ncbi:MAG: alpha/beta fold hydrolase [Oscillospiraceae bacterium]|nr:alpha/beta fold hydrolase [Oscillospiraceae bacterium]
MAENALIGEGTPYPLNGKKVLPDPTEGRVPAVVFVHGSGASNMDEQIYSLTPFRDLAEGLAARGIASIRYDKRTFVYARKMRGQSVTVKEETVEDAIRAAGLLRLDPRVDPDRIYIVGHSMGAMLAPRIDAEGGDFRGLILMAGTPYRLEDIVVRQLRQAAGSRGGLMKAIVALEDRIFSRKFDRLYEMTEEEAKKKKFAGSVTLWYFREMGRKTAADYIRETDKPVLILQGGMDFQVLPSVDFEGFKEQLRGRENVEYRLYPELNHLFVKGIYNDILKAGKEYRVEQHIGPEVIDDIAAFIRRGRAAGED